VWYVGDFWWGEHGPQIGHQKSKTGFENRLIT
jgi:hypothetical protein